MHSRGHKSKAYQTWVVFSVFRVMADARKKKKSKKYPKKTKVPFNSRDNKIFTGIKKALLW